jgi:protein-tyrosine phosphatase
MGFPARGNEGIYRNNAVHVTEFLTSKHGEQVKVYNLCSERDYPKELFGGRVSKYPFDDHNPPPMSMFLPYCKDVCQWLDANPQNVVAIHCKAGKGRTGVMICAYLLYVGEWEDPYDCMQFYGFARTNDQKGVTIPSQRRFITYFAELCRSPNPSSSSSTQESSSEDVTAKGQIIKQTNSFSFEETLGVEEKESSTPAVRGFEKSKRKKSMIGVDLDVLKAEMDHAKDGLASGDENESDSEDEKNDRKFSAPPTRLTSEELQEV